MEDVLVVARKLHQALLVELQVLQADRTRAGFHLFAVVLHRIEFEGSLDGNHFLLVTVRLLARLSLANYVLWWLLFIIGFLALALEI